MILDYSDIFGENIDIFKVTCGDFGERSEKRLVFETHIISDNCKRKRQNMDQNRLERQLDFILEADKEKRITRQNYNTDCVTKEDDAEHAWHLAVMAVLLAEYSNEPIDLLKVLKMLLLHDIVEIDAGDTYAYDEQGRQTQAEREAAAADRIYGLLPEDQRDELKGLFDEFNEQKTPEARFARTMDNFQPMMLNDATDGKSWVEHDVHIDQILGRNENSRLGSEDLWEYARNNWLERGLENGVILP